MDPETSWTISEKVNGISDDSNVGKENVFEHDPETENELRFVVSKIFLETALITVRRSFWSDYKSRVELLIVIFRFMRWTKKNEEHVKKMVEFIVETKFGGAEEMAEFKDMGYSFQDKYVLEIVYALGDRTPDGFMDKLVSFYEMDVFTLYTKKSIRTLRAYIERIANDDVMKLEEMKALVMKMILTCGNPSFSHFGLVLRYLYDETSGDGKFLNVSSIKHSLKLLAKDNEKVFLNCEDSIFEMFKEMKRDINATCEIDEISLKEIKGIIHKNTTLNTKSGKIVNKYEKDGDNKTTWKSKNKRSLNDYENDILNSLRAELLQSSDNVDNEIPKSKKIKRDKSKIPKSKKSKRDKSNEEDEDGDDGDSDDGDSDDSDYDDEEGEDEEGEEDEKDESD